MLDNFLAIADDGAKLEYEQCVQGTGFLSARPGFLPYCAAWSTDAQFVIGPVVNTAGCCARWTEGTPSSDIDTALDALLVQLDEARDAVDENSHLEFSLPSPPGDITAWGAWLRFPFTRARLDVVGFCLEAMRVPEAYVEGVVDAVDSKQQVETKELLRRIEKVVRWHEQNVGPLPPQVIAYAQRFSLPLGTQAAASSPAPVGRTALAEMPAHVGVPPQSGIPRQSDTPEGVLAATAHQQALTLPGQMSGASEQREPGLVQRLLKALVTNDGPPAPPTNVPFLIQPNTEYRHPQRLDVTVAVHVTESQPLVVVTFDGNAYRFDLSSFPPQAWVPLQGAAGLLPVQVMSQLPQAVFGFWL
jgi:hypothetical protein